MVCVNFADKIVTNCQHISSSTFVVKIDVVRMKDLTSLSKCIRNMLNIIYFSVLVG